MPFERLFQPITLGSHCAKNRIVFPPCVVNFGAPSGEVTERALAYYEARARGGAGTVIVEAAFVRQDGKVLANELGAHDDAMIPGLRRLAAAIKRHGALAILQINHCGRQGRSKTTGFPLVSSSALPCPVFKEAPRALSEPEVGEMVMAYAAAAARTQEAGFDGVEVHGAHGYLVAQFMSPYVNSRSDNYGGDRTRRMRFPLRILAAIRQRCGPDFGLFFRLSGAEYVSGGLTLEDTKPNAQLLESAGVDALHVSVGVYETFQMMYPSASEPRGCLVHLAEGIKSVVKVPVIAVGKITDPAFAEGVLAAGRADMVAIGRGLFVDPEFPNKAAAGRAQGIQRCTGCRACVNSALRAAGMICPSNPVLGREAAFAQPINAARVVGVVGNGPAAMQAAWVAALRGHRVTLWPMDGPLGGPLARASGPANLEAAQILKFIGGKLAKAGVSIQLGTNIGDHSPELLLVEEGIDGLPSSLPPHMLLPAVDQPRRLFAALDAGAEAALVDAP